MTKPIVKTRSNRKKVDKIVPGHPMYEASQKMKAKWRDPEYRKKMSDSLKAKWQDPAYVALHMASKKLPIPAHRLPDLAIHFTREAKRLRTKAKEMLKKATELDYQAAACKQGENPKYIVDLMHTNSARKYKGPDATARYLGLIGATETAVEVTNEATTSNPDLPEE